VKGKWREEGDSRRREEKGRGEGTIEDGLKERNRRKKN
jgi:hypothetical protein